MKREVLRTLRFLARVAFRVHRFGAQGRAGRSKPRPQGLADGRVAEAINAFYDLVLVYGPREVYDPCPNMVSLPGTPQEPLRRLRRPQPDAR